MMKMIQMWIAFFEIWLCYQFLYIAILEPKLLTKKNRLFVNLNIIIVGLLLSINREILFFSYSMMIFCALVICINLFFIIKKNLFLITNLVFLYFLGTSLLDLLFSFWGMIFLQTEFEEAVYWYANSYWKIGILLCTRSITGIIVFYLRKNRDREIDIREFQNIILSANLVLFVVMRGYQFVLVNMSNGILQMRGDITSFSLLIIIVIVIFVSRAFVKSKMLQKQNEMLNMREKLKEQSYQELVCILEQNRQLIHDIKNHMIILQSQERTYDYEGIANYAKELEKVFLRTTEEIWTGNKVVDLILRQKKYLAEERNIEFFIETIFLPQWPFKDSELCSLFGNLLDNSIEACEKIKKGKRWIKVQVEKQNRLLFLDISNSIEEKILVRGGKLITNKKDKENHGYGLKGIERIVNKYEGEMSYQVKGNLFKIIITFFLK